MTVETAVFTCSICGEPSRDICVFCTKDACANHRCERCKRCSDCCECEVPLSAAEVGETHAPLEGPLGDGHGSASPAAQTPEPGVELAPAEPAFTEPRATAEPEASQSSEPEASQSSSSPDEMAP